MFILALGIILFLGVHSLPTFPAARAGLAARIGRERYKGLHALLALVGLILIVWGFARYRQTGEIALWTPIEGARHAAIALMWLALVSLALVNPAPGRRIAAPSRVRGWIKHPLLTAVMLWAAAHLVANGDAGSVLLFGAFFVWTIYDRVSVTRRGDPGAAPSAVFTRADALAVAVGTLLWAALIFLHPYVIGVAVVMW